MSCHEWLEDERRFICSVTLEDIDEIAEENRPSNCPLVEIITCKNCNHWNFNENASILCGYCSQFETETGEDFYCADGERREL